jgi:hypothetical protein
MENKCTHNNIRFCIILYVVGIFLTFLFLTSNSPKIYAGCTYQCASPCSQNWPFKPPDQCVDESYKGCTGSGGWKGCCLIGAASCTWTVSSAGNGGTCSPASQKISGGAASGPVTCSRSGYTFSGFTITPGSCGGTFNSSTGVCSKVTGDMTIQANWTINQSYKVTVDGTGGTCSPGTHNVNSGSPSLAQSCMRTGYIFRDFTITPGACSSFDPVRGVCHSVTQNITIGANWDVIYYLVSVDGNGGSCSPGSHYVDYGRASSAQTCTKAGYAFSGFSITKGSCGGSFNLLTGVCSKVTGSIEIKANWQCTPATSCKCEPPFTNTYTPQYGQPRIIDCSDGCGGTISSQCWCTRDCTLPSCPAGTSSDGTHGTYGVYGCSNECGKYLNRSCYCVSACTPASCPTGTTETNTGDSYSSYSCTNMCSESQTRNCYCSICTPPTCLSSGYNDTNLGYGQVPLEKTPSCRNGYNAPNYISKCDMTYRTCYCPSCLKQCPSPLANTGSANLILNDFRECTNDCDVKPSEDEDDCYEVPSEQPTESLVINGEEADPNDFGFLSLTHTGDNKNIPNQGDLNDPLSPIRMEAGYRDENGVGDIEGLFVWFREQKYSGELGTPVYLSENALPKASANDSWGFMLRRDGSGWKAYVPSYEGTSIYWTKATTLNTPDIYMLFFILGPNGKEMVQVIIPTKPEEASTDGKNLTMVFDLHFSDKEGNLFEDPAAEGKYNIYLMGLDKFSFTPYDNYNIDYQNFWSENFKYYGHSNLSPYWKDNQLRYKEGIQNYARDWSYTGQTWTIDRTGPYIEAFAFGTSNDDKLEVHWNVRDDRNLYAVVGNIYTTGGAFSRPIELLSNDPDNEIALLDPGSVLTFHNPNPFIPRSTAEADDIGKINGDWAFKVGPDSLSLSSSHSIYIDMGQNTTGLFDIHLTVFDDAGNFSTSKISINIADWFATAGGLAYSAEGTYFSTKNFVATEEGQPLPYPSENPGLQFGNSDYSSELWGEKNDENPEPLERSNETKSYNVTRYLGYKSTEGYYDYLKKEYEMNKKNIDNLEEVSPESPDLFGSLKGICNNQPYCMFEYTGDLNVKGDVICDNRSLIFVGGKLTIETPLKNTSDNQLSNKNGCIFVVKDDVIVQKGENMSSTSLGYDIVHGYILADGVITIDDERPKDGIIDGVYINGGLSSSYIGGTSIMINRYLRVEEKFTYPVLVIDYHPKYGVIAEKFFGRKSTVKAVEIGVKP